MPQLQIIGETPTRDSRPRSVRLIVVSAILGVIAAMAVTTRTMAGRK